jgi:molybdopterin-guanine dinucleotide biosynthesis protein A
VTPLLVAVVLAGGDGLRMGGAKPLRRLGDTTLLGRALALAQSYSDDVAVAVRDAAQVGGADGPHLLLDDPGIEGPLAGLASALRFARRRGAACVLTLPCDSPRLPADLASRLQTGLGGHHVAVAQSDGRLHPVCALWRTGALDALPAYLASGQRSLKGFAAKVGMTVVEWPASRRDAFVNANTPEDLAALQPRRGHVAAPS